MSEAIKIIEEQISADAYIDFLKITNLSSQYQKERFHERIEKLVRNVPISLIAINKEDKIIGVFFGLSDFAYGLHVTYLGKNAHEVAGGEKDISIYLVANEKAITFYEKLGMKKTSDVMEYCHVEWTSFKVE